MSNVKRPKRILMISTHSAPNIGGIETHIRLLMKSLAEKSFDVTLLTYQPLTTHTIAPHSEDSNNIHIRRYALLGNHISTLIEGHPALNILYLSPYLFFRSFLYMLKNHKDVDVIHAFGLNAGLIARILASIFRKPVLLTTKGIHGFHKGTLPGKLIALILKKMNTVLLGSLDSKDDYINIGVNQSKLKVFSHWIDKYNVTSDKKTLGWNKAFTAIYTGRLIPQKGIPLIIELAQAMPEVQFKIIGDGLLRDQVVKAEKKITNLSYLRTQTPENIAAYHSAADVFIYPINYREDTSIAVLESLAQGTPVISSYQGSGNYLISDNVGIIAHPELKDFINAIETLQKDPALLKKMSENARIFAKKFANDNSDQVIEIYNNIM